MLRALQPEPPTIHRHNSFITGRFHVEVPTIILTLLYSGYVKSIAKRVLVEVVGWSFIVLGIVGLFLPVLQGVLFLLIGLTILSTEYVWAHQLLRKLRDRFPRLSEKVELASRKASEWLRRMAGHREVD
jgi:uncharacterized protein